MKVLDITGQGESSWPPRNLTQTPSKCALPGQGSVLCTVLSILLHQGLTPLLPSTRLRTREVVGEERKPISPPAPSGAR